MRQSVQVLVYPARARGAGWEYLLLRRLPHRGGFWQGVTGGVEADETLLAAARRELREETGLEPAAIEAIDYKYTFEVEDQDRSLYALEAMRIEERVFVAQISGSSTPTIDSREHDDWKWCEVAEALANLAWPENREALKRCDAVLRTSRQRTLPRREPDPPTHQPS